MKLIVAFHNFVNARKNWEYTEQQAYKEGGISNTRGFMKQSKSIRKMSCLNGSDNLKGQTLLQCMAKW